MPIFFKRSTFCRFSLLFAFALLGVQAAAEEGRPAAGYSLQDCYLLALNTSERLKRSAADIEIAEAQYRQSMSYVYPQLFVGATQVLRDNADFGRVVRNGTAAEDGTTVSGGRSGTIGRSQFEGTVFVSQQLFNGFRDFIIADALQQESEALRFDLKRNREVLFQDVAVLFYQVRRSEDELLVIESSRKTIDDRIGELGRFMDLGKARESEVLAARSDLQELLALKEQTTGLLRATKELLAFLTGVPAAELQLNAEKVVEELQPLDSYLQRMGGRNDLKASKLRVSAQEERVKAAKRGHWPQLELLANSYPYEDPDRNREWDLLFNLSIPVFDGGRISAQTAEEQARLRSAGFAEQETSRIIEREVRANYERALAGLKEVESLEKLLADSRKSYDLQKKDYEFGVVSNLEVLQAIRTMQDAERKLVTTRYILAINLTDLEVAAGGFAQ